MRILPLGLLLLGILTTATAALNRRRPRRFQDEIIDDQKAVETNTRPLHKTVLPKTDRSKRFYAKPVRKHKDNQPTNIKIHYIPDKDDDDEEEEVHRTYEETHEHINDEPDQPSRKREQAPQASEHHMRMQHHPHMNPGGMPLGDSNMPEESKNHEIEDHKEKVKVKHHHHHHHHNHVKHIVKKVPVEKIVHVPVEKIVHVPKPYPVEKIVEKKVEKIVEKKVPVEFPKCLYFGISDSLTSSIETFNNRRQQLRESLATIWGRLTTANFR
ncbi:hypothetical protein ACFFRR_004698 [Megaselia abdita]